VYIGMTNDLERRIQEHQQKRNKEFTSQYNINKLVYYGETNDVHVATAREKEVKKWLRGKKDMLVHKQKPTMARFGS